jgi:hypothetical protein
VRVLEVSISRIVKRIVAARLKETGIVAVRPIKGYPMVILVIERPTK